jgi:hypothetical protein
MISRAGQASLDQRYVGAHLVAVCRIKCGFEQVSQSCECARLLTEFKLPDALDLGGELF